MVGGLKFQQKKSENRIDFNSFSSMANTFSFILFAPDKRNKSHSTRTGTKNKSSEQQFNVSIFFFFSIHVLGWSCFFSAHVLSFVFGRCAFCCRHCLDEYCDRLLVSVPSHGVEKKNQTSIDFVVTASGAFFSRYIQMTCFTRRE